jgi:dipeptidyl aminopeptidase/acylaminoacyl peptidase
VIEPNKQKSINIVKLPMVWLAVASVVLILGLYLGVCWWITRPIIELRTRAEHLVTPAELGFPKAKSLSFKSADDQVVLRGWLLRSPGERAIILLHGIDSHSWDGQAPDVVRAYLDAGFAVLLYDLRGHGDSGGDYPGFGWKDPGDVRAAVNVLLSQGFRPGKIGIHGTSYGGAIALLAAADIPEIGAVVADSAFSDLLDIIEYAIERETRLPPILVKLLLPCLKCRIWKLYSLKLDEVSPEEAIASISPRPILLIRGEEDPIIPVEHAVRLKEAAGDGAELWLFPGRQHTEGVRLAPDYVEYSPMRGVFLKKVTQFFERSL